MRLERRIILLTFLGIILATAVVAILVILGLFPKADPQLAKWLFFAVGGQILGELIYFLRSRPAAEGMLVNLTSPPGVELQSLEFDVRNCRYEILDERDEVKSQGRIVPTLGPGGYQCRLPLEVNPSDYVKLHLVERNGMRWEVGYFCPYVTNQQLRRRGRNDLTVR